MAGNVSGLHVFTGDVGPEALSLLDGNFAPLATALNTLANFSNYYVDTGALNILTVTTTGSQVFTYSEGVVLDVKVAVTTTSTTPTLNVNALGAKTIANTDGTALSGGAMVAGGRYRLIYDGAVFRVQNPTVSRGVILTKVKSATTSRNTTTTLANDPDLTIALLAAATFSFEICAFCNGTTTGTQGIAANVNYSAGFTAAGSNASVLLTPTPSFFVSAVQSTVTGSGGIQIGTIVVAGAGASILLLKGSLVATAAGTIAFAWAQSSSSANNTNVLQGSYMTVTQLS